VATAGSAPSAEQGHPGGQPPPGLVVARKPVGDVAGEYHIVKLAAAQFRRAAAITLDGAADDREVSGQPLALVRLRGHDRRG
jgi:hypothetical protein